MSENTTDRTQQFNEVLERFSRLNTEGMHYFIRRLIGDGMEKPVLLREIERAMQRLETDSNLKPCWKETEPQAAQASPALAESFA